MNVIVKNRSNVQQVDANKYIYVTNVSGGTTVTYKCSTQRMNLAILRMF